MIDLEEGFASVNCSNCGTNFDFSSVDHDGEDFNCPECGAVIEEDWVTIDQEKYRAAMMP